MANASSFDVLPSDAPINHPPTAVDHSFFGSGYFPLVVRGSDLLAGASDLDAGDTIHVVSVGQPSQGSVTFVPGTGALLFEGNFFGDATLSYTIADNHGAQSTGLITFTMGIPSVFANMTSANTDQFSATSGVALHLSPAALLANDLDYPGAPANSLSLVAVLNPQHGSLSFDPATGQIIFTPDPGMQGQAGFDYWEKDLVGLSGVGHVTLNVSPTSSSCLSFVSGENATGRGANGIAQFAANTSGNSATNGAVGWQWMDFSSGYGAVVLDGPRSQYAVDVNSTGTTTITDLSTGNTTSGLSISVTGESYLIFHGGSHTTSNGAPIYDEIYFVEDMLGTQVAELYRAALGRQPDLAGLEYWQNSVKSGASLQALAQNFLGSNEFVANLGGTPTGNGAANAAWVASLSPAVFVTELYNNVLNRAPDASGLQYWVNDLAHDSQANVLASFAVCAENFSHASATSPGGWLINPAAGGYSGSGTHAMSADLSASQAVDDPGVGLIGMSNGGA